MKPIEKWTNPMYSSFIPVSMQFLQWKLWKRKNAKKWEQSIAIIVWLSLGKALMYIQDNKKQICITEMTNTLKVVTCKMVARTKHIIPVEKWVQKI